MRLTLRYVGRSLPVRATWISGELVITDPFLALPVAARRLCLGEGWEQLHDDFTQLLLPLVRLLAVPLIGGWVEVTGCSELRAGPPVQGELVDSPWTRLPTIEQRAVATAIGEVVDNLQTAKDWERVGFHLQALPQHPILLPYWHGIANAPKPLLNVVRDLATDTLAHWQTGLPEERYYGYPGYNQSAEALIAAGIAKEQLLYPDVPTAFARNYPAEYFAADPVAVSQEHYFHVVRTQLHPRYVPTPADWSYVFDQILGPPLSATVAIHFLSYTFRPTPWLLQQETDGTASRYSLNAQPLIELPAAVTDRIVAYASGALGTAEFCGPIAEQCLANLAQVGMARTVYVDWLLGRALRSTDLPAGPVIAVALAATYLYGYRQEEIYNYLQHHLRQGWPFSARELFVQVGYWLEDDKYEALWDLCLQVYPELRKVTPFGLADRRSRLFRRGNTLLPYWQLGK